MPFDSVICRRTLDEDRGNPWICECPMCQEVRKPEGNKMKETEREGEVSGIDFEY